MQSEVVSRSDQGLVFLVGVVASRCSLFSISRWPRTRTARVECENFYRSARVPPAALHGFAVALAVKCVASGTQAWQSAITESGELRDPVPGPGGAVREYAPADIPRAGCCGRY